VLAGADINIRTCGSIVDGLEGMGLPPQTRPSFFVKKRSKKGDREVCDPVFPVCEGGVFNNALRGTTPCGQRSL